MSDQDGNLKGILVGCGFMGGMHAQIYNILEGVDLVAAVDKRVEESQEKLDRLGCQAKVYATLDEAMEQSQCDFVDVCLPTHLHEAFSIKALDAGKALFCEKPLALTVEEADRIIEAAKRNEAFAQVGHCLRFWPEYQKLLEYHSSGEGGRLLSLSFVRRGARPNFGVDDWFNDESLSGSAALDLHIHDTDIMLAMLGQPKAIHSKVTRDYSGPSHIYSLFEYDSLIVSSEGGFNYPAKWGFQMAFQAVFEKAVLDFDSSNGNGLMICQGDEEPTQLEVPKPDTGSSQSGEGNVSDLGGYFNELQYFTNCLKSGKKPEIATLEEAREAVAMALKEVAIAEGKLS